MSVRAVCPECGATTTLDDAAGVKTVPCGQCGTALAVPAKKPTGPPPLPPKPGAATPVAAPPPPPQEEPAFEVMEDEEIPDAPMADDDEMPEPVVFNDEDDEDLEVVGGDDEDDDDDEGHSIPRRRPGEGGSVPRSEGRRFVVALTLLFCVGLIAAVGGTVAYLTWPKTKTEAEIREEEDRLAKAARPNRPDADPPPDPKTGPEAKPKDEPKTTLPKDKKTDLSHIPVPDPLPITPVAFDGVRKTVPLPEAMADVCAAAEGRFLVMHGATQPKLYVYDVCQTKIVKEFPTAGKDARFTAGLRHILLADNTTRWLQRIDLTTMVVDLAAPYPFPGAIEDLAAGRGSTGSVMVLATEPKDDWPAHFIDLATLAPTAKVAWQSKPPADLPRSLTLNASGDGTRWIGVPTGKDAKGGVFIERKGNLLSWKLANPEGVLGYGALSASGDFFFSRAANQDFGSQVTMGTKDSPGFIVPAASGPVAVHFTETESPESIRVVLSRENQVAALKPQSSVEITPPYAVGDPLTPDRRAFYAPASGVLVTYPSGGEPRLELYKLDLTGGLPAPNAAIVSTPPTGYHPGTLFSHRLKVVAAGKPSWQLTGVPGVTIDGEGVIRWAVPKEQTGPVVLEVEGLLDGAGPLKQKFTLTDAGPAPPKPPAVVAKPPVGPKVVAKPPEPKKVEGPIAVGATLVQPAAGKLPINPPAMDAASLDIDLPGPIRDACVGGGGRFLIFHCPTARKLAIFDVNTLKVEKTLTLNVDDVLFAAGMEKLFVVYPDEKLVIRYSLATFKLEADVTLEFLQKPTAAAMGSATDGPLILGGIPSQDNASKMALAFLDTATMKEVKIDKADGNFGVSFRASAHLRASADGRTLGAWLTRLEPSGLQVARLAGNTITGSHKAESVGHVSPSADGRNVFTNRGVFNAETLAPGLTVPCVPSVHGNGYATIDGDPNGPQTVKLTLQDSPMGTFTDLPGFDGKRDPFQRDNPTLTLDRRLFYVPAAKILAVIPPAANKLHIRRVGDGK